MKKAAGPDDLLAEHLKEGGPAAVEDFQPRMYKRGGRLTSPDS